jgi:CheY-like chemotaxis protein
MSIAKRLVDMMNGEILVESEPGRGSVFTVRLPQQRIGSAVCGTELAEKMRRLRFQSISKMKKARIVREYMPYGRVLVVDDMESNLYVAKGLLLPYGLQIETAVSGFEAIEKIKAGEAYDIVFMDHMMPGMDGMEAAGIIRSLGYTRPIVALTANAVLGQAEMFLANGFENFISKPIDSRELNTVLNNLVRDRQPPEVVEAARREKKRKKAAAPAQGREREAAETPKASGPSPSPMAEFFVRDAEKAVEALEGILGKGAAAEEADLRSFVVSVHGIKSSLANIGETGLSGRALELEEAGRERDMVVISAETPAFLSALKAHIAKIKPRPEYAEEISAEEAAYLRGKLSAIQAACAAYDNNAAKAALDELRQKTWPSRTADRLEAVAGHLLHSAFKKAADAAGEALE